MMDFLNKLIWTDAPAGTSLQSVDLSLRGLFPLWLAIILLLGGVLAAFFFYRTEQAPMGLFRRSLLIVLRVAVISIILVLLLRPVAVAEFHGERPQGVAVLLDNSESMKLQDRRVAAADKLRVA